MRNIISVFMLLCVAALLFSGADTRIKNGSDFNITNATSTIEWDFEYNESTDLTQNIINKWADAAGYSIIEISKATIRYGFNHPEYDFDYFFEFVKFILYILIILALVKVAPVLLAAIYLLFLGVKKLIIKIKERSIQKKFKVNRK